MAFTLKEKISSIIKIISEPKILRFFLAHRYSGYLFEQGWFNSFKVKTPVGKNFEPLPWMTYSFIDFIKERLNKELTIFEFGSGNSTLFFAERVKKVVAVEHNKEWYEKIKNKIPYNVVLHIKDQSEEYQNTLTECGKFDIIIIDGENRNECMHKSIEVLTPSGIIILDDSERPDYALGINFLIKSEFRRIDFWGFSPGLFYKKCTSIFYKDKNCFGI